MDNQPSCEQLRSELRRRGLPRAYIERLLAELDDHFADILEERSTSMGAARKLQFESDTAPDDLQARLGNPTQLAIFAADQYHARSFWGRHPRITFLLAPLPLLLACFISFGLALVSFGKCLAYGLEHVLGWKAPNPHDYLMLQGIAMGLTSWYILVLPPLVAALLLCRVAQRNALNWRWPAAACALLAFVVAGSAISYTLATEPNNGRLMVGFGFSGSPDWLFLIFLPKFALALGIGLLLVRRARDQLQCGT